MKIDKWKDINGEKYMEKNKCKKQLERNTWKEIHGKKQMKKSLEKNARRKLNCEDKSMEKH